MIIVKMDFDERKIFGPNGRLMQKIKYYKNVLPREAATIYAESIAEIAKAKFEHPRPYLATRIKPKKVSEGSDKNMWSVVAPAYAVLVDRGRLPGKAPPETLDLGKWARAANINLFWLRWSIAEHGTKGKKFIRPGMALARTRVRELMMRRSGK